MRLIITADDLSAGMFVAVHSSRAARQIRVRRLVGDDAAFEVDDPTPLPASVGVPLQVIGISLPFVACGVLKPGGGLGGPVIIDLRAVELSRLTPEFVVAIEHFKSDEEEAAPPQDHPLP